MAKLMVVLIIVLALGGMAVMASMSPEEIAEVATSRDKTDNASENCDPGDDNNITFVLTGDPDGEVALFVDSLLTAHLSKSGSRSLSLNVTERCGLSVRINNGLNEGANAWQCIYNLPCLTATGMTVVIDIAGTQANVR